MYSSLMDGGQRWSTIRVCIRTPGRSGDVFDFSAHIDIFDDLNGDEPLNPPSPPSKKSGRRGGGKNGLFDPSFPPLLSQIVG